jgi:hypothetical protein
MTNPDSDARLEELISVGARLLGEIESFTREGGTQFVTLARAHRADRRAIWLIGASLVLDLVLTAVMAFGWVQVSNNQHSIANVNSRIDYSQTVERQKVLCPLYQLLVDSKSAAGRAASPDPKEYDHTYAVVQQGYDALGCAAYISSSKS